MGKIGLIIAREYLSKIRNKTFILLTLLVPVAYGLIIAASVYFSTNSGSTATDVQVVDQSGLFTESFTSDDQTTFHFIDNIDKKTFQELLTLDEQKGAGLFIPEDVKDRPTGVTFYFKENPGSAIIRSIERAMEDRIETVRMNEKQLDRKTLEYLKVDVDLAQYRIGEDGAEKSNSGLASAVASISAFVLYFFIFIYGSMVLRGVQEEKSSRIVEIIISSVKPFQLMMGKILGNGLLGLTQFAIWIVLIFGIGFVLTLTGAQPPQAGADMPAGVDNEVAQNMAMEMVNSISNLPIIEVVVYFVLFFLGGYFLYSSLFAAVAAAVDSQQDMQQFMLPVSIPLILAVVFMGGVVQNPNSTMAIVFSMVPFTSPIIMVARIPFGVPWYEPVISLVILIATFILCVYIAGKVYRVGLLMYGSKPTWKQLGKWIIAKD